MAKGVGSRIGQNASWVTTGTARKISNSIQAFQRSAPVAAKTRRQSVRDQEALVIRWKLKGHVR